MGTKRCTMHANRGGEREREREREKKEKKKRSEKIKKLEIVFLTLGTH